MPKKISSAVAGTLAVGLTMPVSVAAAQAAAPIDTPLPPPQLPTGTGVTVPASSLSEGVNISSSRTSDSYANPLADAEYTFSTGHGPRCISVQGASTYHLGQDLVAEEDTPFAAVADGTVVRTVEGTASRAGFIVVRHSIGGETFHSGYIHVWDAESHVSVGDTVRAGETIGLVGDSGPTVTPHLHVEIWQGGWHTGTALDPADWLAERGVNMRDAAESEYQREVPESCDYFAAQSTPLRASAEQGADVVTQLQRGAELTSVPGDAENGFVRVSHDGTSGWVQQGHLTPDRPSGSSTEPAGSSGTGSSSSHSVGSELRVTEPLNARSGPGTQYGVLQGLGTGTTVTVTATSGAWVQFVRNGQRVWSHGAYLAAADEQSGETDSSSAGNSQTPASDSGSASQGPSGRGTHEVTTPLNLRSGAGSNHSVTGGMQAGEQVTVGESRGDWVAVRRANGQQGWAHGAYLRSLSSGQGQSSASSGSSTGTSSSAGSSSSASKESSGPSSSSSSSSEASHRVQGVHLNLRSGPGTEHSVVSVLAPGSSVQATGRNGSWVSIQQNGRTVWLHGDYLQSLSSGSSESESTSASSGSSSQGSGSSSSGSASQSNSSSQTGTSSSAQTARTTAWQNVRSGAGMNHGVVRTVPSGTQLEVLGTSGGWIQVRAHGTTGWMWGEYLELPRSLNGGSGGSAEGPSSGSSGTSEGSSSGSGSTSSGSSSSGSSSGGSSSASGSSSSSSGSSSSSAGSSSSEGSSSGTSTTRAVNMRSGAGTDHSVTRIVPSGTQLEVLGTSDGWIQVRANGATGWIWQDYVRGAGSSSGSSSSTGSSGSSGNGDSGSSSGSSGSSSSGASNSGSSDSSSSESSSSGTESSGSSGGNGSSSGGGSSSSGSGSASSDSGTGSGGSGSSSSGSGSSSSSGNTATTSSAVNMRSGAGMNHGVTRVVSAGAELEILDQSGGWFQVRVNGATGWIWQDFISGAGSSGSSPAGSGSSSSDSSSGSSGSSSSSGSGSSGGSSSSSGSGSSGGDSSSGSGSSGSGSSGSGSSQGRTGPTSGQHAQSSHGPYSSAWDRLAECESNQNWSINTGNGYYGGLQFSAQSWNWVGGSGLPHQASRQEQIERAHILWQRQGWGAWPACSARLGLSGDPGGWGNSYLNLHGSTSTVSLSASADEWRAVYSVPLREQPSAGAEKLTQIPRGSVLQAGERSGSWVQVTYEHRGEELTGWVNTQYVSHA